MQRRQILAASAIAATGLGLGAPATAQTADDQSQARNDAEDRANAVEVHHFEEPAEDEPDDPGA